MTTTAATMATDAVLTMEGDSVESCGKHAFTKKNWASKAWATVRDIANSAGRVRGLQHRGSSERRGHPAPPQRACQADTYKSIAVASANSGEERGGYLERFVDRGVVLRLIASRENRPPL
jgi:hypothetical protein